MPENTIPGVKIESLETVINGRRIHYLKAGAGRPVMLLHGGASDSREWRPIIAKYADRFSFYAPDMPGFGTSDRDPKGYYLTEYAEFLQGFIAFLKLDRPAVVGHSLGARICLDAVRMPGSNIGKLILIDASGLGKMSPFGIGLFYFFKWTRTLLLHPQPFPEFLSKEGVDWNDVGDEALKNINVPTLLIWKSFDPYLPLRQGRRAEKLIPGAKLAVVKGYGHAPHQQNDNSAFCALMLEFLNVKGGGD
jgi:pimeloyl-ACP methyl ester carboxylesterase